MSDKELVAVYGTLKHGESNHLLLSGSIPLLLHGETEEKWDMVTFGPYPALIPGDQSVEVEVYSVDKATMDRLDKLEGYPFFYQRKKVVVFHGDISLEEASVEAWIYYLPSSDKPKWTTYNMNGALKWSSKINLFNFNKVKE